MAKKLSNMILDRRVQMDFPAVGTAPVLASYDPNELSGLAPYTLDELLFVFTKPGTKRSFAVRMADAIRFAFTMEAFWIRQITTRIANPKDDIRMTISTNDNATIECLLTNKIRQTDALTIRSMDVNKMGGLDASN